MSSKLPKEEIQLLLKSVCDFCEKEDQAVRFRQIRQWRKFKLYWNGFQRLWDDGVAHDWRVWDGEMQDQNNDAAYYDKPINVFRAYLESIIAALSITIPAISCLPDDANNSLDIATAKAGDEAAKLIYKHNDVSLLWLSALYILCTEGLIACYAYPKEDEKYGTYDEPKMEETEEEHYQCVSCGAIIPDEVMNQERNDLELNEFMPDDDDVLIKDALNQGPVCPDCMAALDPALQKSNVIVERQVGITSKPKSRICMEMYGGLFVKVPNYARTQRDCPYLRLAYETNFVCAIEKYPDLYEKINQGGHLKSGYGGTEAYERWARLSTQYMGDYPINTVTIRQYWLRPSSFNSLPTKEKADKLKKLYPDGAKVDLVNEEIAAVCNESLDDCWTLSYNPLSDYVHFEPMGALGVSTQDITNDLISLSLQTIEQGIPQTFVDPAVFDLEAYSQSEASPGTIYPTKPVTANKNLAEAFTTLKTASLSPEVMPFGKVIQDLGQLALGALPSLFGGMAEAGSKTASEYSMSRAQALQRQQNTWKMLTFWWKNIFGKVIPMYFEEMMDDERLVSRDQLGNYTQTLIKKAETEGKIGSVELEASENLPMTQQQKKDVFIQLMGFANPKMIEILSDPSNIPFLTEALGLPELNIPGDGDRIKQWDEIRLLVNSQPLDDIEPSVPIDPVLDNHIVEAETCRFFLISEEGRLIKDSNPLGYMNVMLHMKQHMAAAAGSLQPPIPAQGQKPNPSGKSEGQSPVEEQANSGELDNGPIH